MIAASQPPTANPYVPERFKELLATDAQFRSAMPDPEVTRLKNQPQLGLAQIIALCMEKYSERPALRRRASELVSDPVTGRQSLQLIKQFETVTYAELWRRARKLASYWYHEDQRSLRANDFICIMAFAGIDFTTVDLAAMHNGAVVVPLQSNASTQQLIDIVKETEPRWIATSLECLPTVVKLVTEGHRPAGVLVFDYHPKADVERETYEAARAQLEAAGAADILLPLNELDTLEKDKPEAPLFEQQDTDQRMCCLYYTSGSTGQPKGAMYPESMLTVTWRAAVPMPLIYMHYMPMNHSFGRSGVFMTLGGGGTCCFTAKSDLSELFEDIKLIRPTFMGIVPRICEMVYQTYQIELERRSPGVVDAAALQQELQLEIRRQVLGGRMLAGAFGSAPLARELREFMEQCFGFAMDENYGATEILGVTRNNKVSRPPIIDYKLDDVPELGYFKTDKPHPRGELWVKTSCIMLGYYKRPEVTASVMTGDGYYKTGDIVAETEPDKLVYVDRRNNVLKLSQGEFVAIWQLETTYTNGHAAIQQVYLYGSSERSYLVGVVVPNEKALRELGVDPADEKTVKANLRDAIQAIARAEELNPYEIPRDFLIEREPFSVGNGLLAGIGKYLRPKFKERFGARLEQLYEDIANAQVSELHQLRLDGRSAPVSSTVARAVKATLGLETIDIDADASFQELGGDSLSALSCSLLLEEIYDVEVPASVINNPSGNLCQIAQFIEKARAGASTRPSFAGVHGKDATRIAAKDLQLEKFIDISTLASAATLPAPDREIRTVLVTGANGYLGRFLCLEWLQRMAEVQGRVVCIVRAPNADAALRRISEVFESGDDQLKTLFHKLANQHLEVLAGDLSEPDLGLSFADWKRLSETVDVIVHPAAFVNHVLPYSQLFGANVVGTSELIKLALTHHLKPFHNISTVGVASLADGSTLDEQDDVRTATPVRELDGSRYADGYINSKWAAEVLLREANERFQLPVLTFRSDMILAHSQYQGQLNVPDMFTRWLLSMALTGIAPRSFYTGQAERAHYDGLPVDFTTCAIATLGSHAGQGYRTYHVVNPHDDGISMDSFIQWAREAGWAIQYIDDYETWLQRFETALRGLPERQRQRTSLPLIHQFKKPWPATPGAHVDASRFHADVSLRRVGASHDIPHLDAPYIRKVLGDLVHLGLLDNDRPIPRDVAPA